MQKGIEMYRYGIHSPRVLMTTDVKRRLDLYIAEAIGEISGLGTVVQIGNDFLVEEIFLLPQKCTLGSTDMSAEGIADFLYERVQSSLSVSNIRLWWHSHVMGDVYWSATDNGTIESSFPNASWVVSVVGNKRGDYLSRLDIYKPFRLTTNGLPVALHLGVDENLLAEVRSEVDQKVTHIALPKRLEAKQWPQQLK